MSDDTAPPSTSEQSTLDLGVPSSDGAFGRYRLLQRLGEGGMGEVWLAEQAEPVHRQVALKVIKAGMDSAQVIARFEAERQALALMDHPAIAMVFDGGTTPQGRPYFAMEYVKGGRVLPDTHPMVAATLQVAGLSLMDLGRAREAESLLRESLELRQRALPPGHWLIAASESALGACLVADRRFGEAEALLLRG